MHSTFIEILAGGLLSSLSGFAATYFQLARTRKNRMNEVMAEKKITADGEAYSHAKRLQDLLYKNLDEAWAYALNSEGWFFTNRLFLPGNFPNKWITARNWLAELVTWRRNGLKTPAEQVKLLNQIGAITAEAMDEVYKDVGGKRIEPEEHDSTA